jgi:sec-independent protein translocase protein TatC
MAEKLQEMSFLEHFSALRRCILFCVLSIIATTIGSLSQVKLIWGWLLIPMPAQQELSLINIAPTEALLIDFKVALLAGIFLASPLLFWFFYNFLSPALFKKERMLFLPIVLFSVLFFLAGAGFSFGVVLPLSFEFLNKYAQGVASQNWTQSNYLNFTMRMILAFAIMFQLPVITFLLAKLKLITATFLIQQARIAILVIFIVAALLTPPEIISQMLLAIPLLLLYGLSIGVAKLVNPVGKKHV